MKVRWLAGQPPAWWIPSALLVSNYAPGVSFFLVGLFGQPALKLVDTLLELLDLDALAFVFTRQPLDDLACVRHLVHVLSTSCGLFSSVSLAVAIVYASIDVESIPECHTNISWHRQRLFVHYVYIGIDCAM